MNTKNIKPFDLQAALNGEPVMLRDGRKAFVRHHETELPVGDGCRLLGYTDRDINISWCVNGSYLLESEDSEDSADIIGMWPKTRIINGFEVPVPETKEPEFGTKYYLASTLNECFCAKYTWDGEGFEVRSLGRGLVFLNKEDAIANAKAMLGIDAIEYTITQVRQKFPLPGEQQTGWNVEGLPPVGWHGECSSDKSDWYECVVLRDGFIAHSDTQLGKEFWRVDSIDGLSFRPLSSERERWVEQALNVLQKDPCAMPAQLMGMIYDAIKSGTLPVPE